MTTKAIEIPTPHGDVPAIVEGPDGEVGIVLAHGAGAGQDHPWMAGLRERCAAAGMKAMTFDYAYKAAGRKAPDRLPKLLDVHEAVATWFTEHHGTPVLAGKSMGGRVGGHLVAERGFEASGLVYLGYPLVAMGKTDPRPTDHLTDVSVPQLFISGERDRMGPIDLIEAVSVSVPSGRVVVAAAGDHSLVPLKSTGRTVDDALDTAVETIEAWMATEGISSS